MKKIKQKADCSITIRRFDTGENITFEKNTKMELDDATADYLLNMKAWETDRTGKKIKKDADFEEEK